LAGIFWASITSLRDVQLKASYLDSRFSRWDEWQCYFQQVYGEVFVWW